MESGTCGVIPKPFSLGKVVELVGRATDAQRRIPQIADSIFAVLQ